MVKNYNRWLLVLGLFFFSVNAMEETPAKKSESPAKGYVDLLQQKRVIIPTSIIIGIGALLLAYRWYTQEPSNKIVYNRARSLYDQLYRKYGTMELLHGDFSEESMNEETLHMLSMNPDIKRIPTMTSNAEHLKKMIERLQFRIDRDSYKGIEVVYDMKSLKNDSEKLCALFEKLALFWECHNAYFTYTQTIDNFTQTYKEYYDDITNHDILKRAIITNVQKVIQHPYSSFLSNLKDAVDHLNRSFHPLQKYPNLLARAQSLHTHLSELYDTILHFPEYDEELQATPHRKNAINEPCIT